LCLGGGGGAPRPPPRLCAFSNAGRTYSAPSGERVVLLCFHPYGAISRHTLSSVVFLQGERQRSTKYALESYEANASALRSERQRPTKRTPAPYEANASDTTVRPACSPGHSRLPLGPASAETTGEILAWSQVSSCLPHAQHAICLPNQQFTLVLAPNRSSSLPNLVESAEESSGRQAENV